MRGKGKWLTLNPWLVGEAEDPDVARMVVDQLKSADETRMSLLEVHYKY
jgi:hypothetical protein